MGMGVRPAQGGARGPQGVPPNEGMRVAACLWVQQQDGAWYNDGGGDDKQQCPCYDQGELRAEQAAAAACDGAACDGASCYGACCWDCRGGGTIAASCGH